MPKIAVVIEYDTPDDPLWLNPDNVALCLHAYCQNTKFSVSWASGGNPWAAPDTNSQSDAIALCQLGRVFAQKHKLVWFKRIFERIEAAILAQQHQMKEGSPCFAHDPGLPCICGNTEIKCDEKPCLLLRPTPS